MVVDSLDKKRKIIDLYYNLLEKHGEPALTPQWSFWCKRPKNSEEKERIVIESILTQRANWKNVELAVSKLQKSNLMSLQNILSTPNKKIEFLIKPSGFYIQKAKRLKNLAKFFVKGLGGIEKAETLKTAELKIKLLEIDGVGDETADDILLYAFERPVFVIDEYTRRFALKHNLTNKLTYHHMQQIFENALEKDYKIYQDYHALIVIEMKGQK
ncbi:MAG: endonuclease [Candidatus Omnitrophica bacterium]|nr:endonuclease [Candidatus Omnitrophota bacterium]MCM8816942.1 endonuclease [Candidatus Omnitrophota bacterium]